MWPCQRHIGQGAVTGADCVRGGVYTGVQGGEGDGSSSWSTLMGLLRVPGSSCAEV